MKCEGEGARPHRGFYLFRKFGKIRGQLTGCKFSGMFLFAKCFNATLYDRKQLAYTEIS